MLVKKWIGNWGFVTCAISGKGFKRDRDYWCNGYVSGNVCPDMQMFRGREGLAEQRAWYNGLRLESTRFGFEASKFLSCKFS